jgi:hypothetical protein
MALPTEWSRSRELSTCACWAGSRVVRLTLRASTRWEQGASKARGRRDDTQLGCSYGRERTTSPYSPFHAVTDGRTMVWRLQIGSHGGVLVESGCEKALASGSLHRLFVNHFTI